MKKTLMLIAVLALSITFASEISAKTFPSGPELSITPGKLCVVPTAYRYPEKIAYCNRDVVYETKEAIIAEYDQKFGYTIASLPREDFKIDHLIPLCVGGDNDVTNLWPQHKSVYAYTDALEPLLCAKMAQGRLKQKDAVSLVLEAKTHLDRAAKIIDYVNKL